MLISDKPSDAVLAEATLLFYTAVKRNTGKKLSFCIEVFNISCWPLAVIHPFRQPTSQPASTADSTPGFRSISKGGIGIGDVQIVQGKYIYM